MTNKKFLETDYPCLRLAGPRQAVGVPACRLAGFASFILASGPKTEILYFPSPRTAKSSSDLSQRRGEEETPRLNRRGILYIK
ncbi:hypothetical protein DHD80_12540 [Gramella sp. AN32]|nr:hypothetical protein [Gramella sp. AN32]